MTFPRFPSLFLCLALTTFAFGPALAVEGDLMETQHFGTTGSDRGSDAIPTQDGGLLLAGHTSATQFGDSDILLVKLDALGEVEWQAALGDAADNFSEAVQQTASGDYIVAGRTRVGVLPSNNALLMRVSADGQMLWLNYYGGPKDDVFYAVRQTRDGGFIAVGYSASNDGGGNRNYIVRTDGQGQLLWERQRDEAGSYLQGVVEAEDDRFVVCGYVRAGGGLAPPYDAILLKLRGPGDLVWRRDFDLSQYDRAYALQQLADGDLVMAGQGAGGMGIWRFSAEGVQRWFHAFQSPSSDVGRGVWPTDDGGFLVGGYTGYEVFVGKTDADGNELWSQHYVDDDVNICEAIVETSQGEYAAFGYASTLGETDHDLVLWRLEGGNVSTAAGEEPPARRRLALAAAPNPFNPRVELTVDLPAASRATLDIHDVSGRHVTTLLDRELDAGIHRLAWNGRDDGGTEMASGVYLVRLRAAGETHLHKLVLVR